MSGQTSLLLALLVLALAVLAYAVWKGRRER